MFLYAGCRRVWITNIIRRIDCSLNKQVCGYTLCCKESPCCSVPFDIDIDEEDTIQLCDEHGFRHGKTYTGKTAFLVIENLKTELLIDKTLA